MVHMKLSDVLREGLLRVYIFLWQGNRLDSIQKDSFVGGVEGMLAE
jgi:hypothetical protein